MPTFTLYEQFIQDCHVAIEDSNLEQCFQLLFKTADPKSSVYDDIRQQSALFKFSAKANHNALLSRDQYRKEYSQTIGALLALLKALKENDCIFIDDIHERILVLSFAESKIDWTAIFPRKKFSHIKIVNYNDVVPEDYQSPIIVLFDDSGPNARPYMLRFAEEMPLAHFLYFGETNPFTESRKRNPQDAAIFDRCANANSKFTVHARLRELLEFRKIYGVP